MCRRQAAIKGGKWLLVLIVAVTMVLGASSAVGDDSREQVIKIVVQIQRADYEGNRSVLARLHKELAPFAGNKELAPRVQYWRGFALWRRAMNGFNEKVDMAELKDDMQHALDDFDDAAGKDPAFLDAKIGALSCLGFLAFSDRQQDMSSPRIQELIVRGRQLRKDVEAVAPENPRFLWVMGPTIWFSPRNAEAARRRRLQPTRRVWKQSGAKEEARTILWSPPGESLNC